MERDEGEGERVAQETGEEIGSPAARPSEACPFRPRGLRASRNPSTKINQAS
jgi:hypothetical protein